MIITGYIMWKSICFWTYLCSKHISCTSSVTWSRHDLGLLCVFPRSHPKCDVFTQWKWQIQKLKAIWSSCLAVLLGDWGPDWLIVIKLDLQVGTLSSMVNVWWSCPHSDVWIPSTRRSYEPILEFLEVMSHLIYKWKGARINSYSNILEASRSTSALLARMSPQQIHPILFYDIPMQGWNYQQLPFQWAEVWWRRSCSLFPTPQIAFDPYPCKHETYPCLIQWDTETLNRYSRYPPVN